MSPRLDHEPAGVAREVFGDSDMLFRNVFSFAGGQTGFFEVPVILTLGFMCGRSLTLRHPLQTTAPRETALRGSWCEVHLFFSPKCR